MMKDAPTNRTPNHIISIPTEATEIRVKGNIISSISNYQGNVFISDTLSQGAPGELGTIYLSRGIGEFEQSFTKAKTATMHIFARSGTGATQSMGRSYLNIYVRNPLLKKSSGLELFPLLSSSIGKKASATSFGAHSDGTRKGGWINTSLSTTATTGNIAPANGVGYMSITGEDGKKYKVLVYGD